MPEQKKKNWFSRHKIISTILAIVVLFFILSAIFGESSEDQAARERQEAAQSTDREANESNQRIVSTISTAAIASAAEGGRCYTEYIEPDESQFASVASMGTRATFYFVKSAEQAFESGKCDLSYTFVYSINGDSSDNEVEKFALGSFQMSREKYNTYDWHSLSGQSVGERLRSDDALRIPNNVMSQINYSDFRYNG